MGDSRPGIRCCVAGRVVMLASLFGHSIKMIRVLSVMCCVKIKMVSPFASLFCYSDGLR